MPAWRGEPSEPEKPTVRLRPVGSDPVGNDPAGSEERRPRARSRWFAVLRKELVFPVLAAVLAGLVVLLVEYGPIRGLFGVSNPVGPPQEWNTHGVAEVVGVQSWGSVGALDDGRVYLTGVVEDTLKDGRGAGLRIEVTHAHGAPWTNLYPNTSGFKSKMTVGSLALPMGGTGELFDDVVRVRVADCLLVRDGNRVVPEPNGCGHYEDIYQAH